MFSDTMIRWLEGIPGGITQNFLKTLFKPLFDRQSSACLTSAGLVIKTSGSALAKTGSATTYAFANGILRSVAGSTDMPALSGTVVNATFNVFCFFIDSGGTVTSAMGTAGATLAAVQFPQIPTGKAMLGFIVINPTGTGNFVGGTTALDDGTVTPNAAYVNTIGGPDPYALTGLV